MHRLFWKIFLSFWFSLILFAGASLLAASLFLERTRAQDAIENPRTRLLTYIEEARFIAETEGIDGLKSWLEKLDRTEAIPFLLVDAAGKDLLERPVSSRLMERLQRGPRPPRHFQGGRPPKHWDLIQLTDGSNYRLVPAFHGVTLGRVLRRPRVIATPVIIAAIVSGLVCFLLARYLTTPIQRLSRATRQFASGDLGLRVAPTMAGRRDEIADLARSFDHMAERLQGLIGSQKRLLSDVSHELRSPLARLQVALGLARQRGQDQTNAELDLIEREAERLNELIGQLLSLTRLESGTALSHSESVDLASLLAEVAENGDFEVRALNRRVHIANSVPATIEANEALLRSALENVVRNAAKYTDENTSVDLSLQPDHEHTGWMLIQVRDHGPGVPEDMLTKLFEPFVRVSDARDRQSGGYGLGLAIAERAIRLHGGEISALNEPNGGLNVRIRLPVDRTK
jgi:two-component system sensor histidine kinase CpxA